MAKKFPEGENWIGDMARAMTALPSLDAAALHKVAAMLSLRQTSPAQTRNRVKQGTAAAEVASRAEPHSQPPPRQRPDQQNTRARREPAPPMSLLVPLGTELAVQRAWTEPVLAETPARRTVTRGVYQSLLPPRSEPAILRQLLSRRVYEGPIDVERTLTILTSGQYVSYLPRHPVRTLRFGVQVLVDIGDGMELFLRDEEELLNRIAAVAGRHACDVRYFADDPMYNGSGAGWTWKPYTAPPLGTRVLVLSDFGRHRIPRSRTGADPGTWQKVVTMLHRAGCLPVALTPLPQSLQPQWLRTLMPVLTWDRTTTAATAYTRLA
ncbi:hypothetical protein [Streptomyces sp. S.PNR 29]|uniref:hypothetical protein n=1 Tax=Streptomyces sp. S.PNR 29 TaxID=2973805 RepID=UPI0025B0B0EB|nr:hypothetical protein [Streptomyces sp. S.PNR 29]MDN0196561.1 hypothetical protein [Streptomyces sp. S.PNR 29]